MDNPIIDDMKEDDNEEITVQFYHEIEDVKINLLFVDEHDDGSEMTESVTSHPYLLPFERFYHGTYEGHKFRAVVEHTNEVLAEFVIRHGQKRYQITKKKSRNEL